MTTNTNETPSLTTIALSAINADKRAEDNKGKATTLTFASLYLAMHDIDNSYSNMTLDKVAHYSKTAKGESYSLAWNTIFGQLEETKLTNTFRDKLKLAFDVLAYVSEIEKMHERKLIVITGEKVKANGLLLNPLDQDESMNWYALDKGAKFNTSVTELRRMAKKFADCMEEPLASKEGEKVGRKSISEQTEDDNVISLSPIQQVDMLSGILQNPKTRINVEMLDALETLALVIADVRSQHAMKQKKAA